jgi:hypothetical protein
MTKAVITIALLTALVGLPAVHAQQVHHAPTVEQCRADQRLWLSKLEDLGRGRAGVATVGYRELDQDWSNQMIECMTVDSENNSRYYNTYGETSAEELLRLENFLRRHNLFDQFLAEDAQGKR